MSEDLKFVDMTNMLIDTAIDGVTDQENKEQAERLLAARKVWLRALQKIASGEFEYARVRNNQAAVKVNIRKRGLPSAGGILEELNEIARGQGYEICPFYECSPYPSAYEFYIYRSERAFEAWRQKEGKGE